MSDLSRRDDSISVQLRVHYAPNGLEIPEGIAYADWLELISTLYTIHSRSLLYLGDALCYGEEHYGEVYAQAVDTYQAKTLANAMSVARRFPLSRRRESTWLTYSHYAECTGLEPAAADHLLAQADTERWSTRQLREAARALRAPSPNGAAHLPGAGNGTDQPPTTEPASLEVLHGEVLLAPVEVGQNVGRCDHCGRVCPYC